jgi:acyl-CoA thioesterase FadM
MIEIMRTGMGKPEVSGDLRNQVAVSLTHDHRYCIGVAGEGEQGIDLEVVTNRSQQEWQELLGSSNHGILAELARTESIHRAGTRIWTVLECLYKALGVRKADLAVTQRSDDAVIFRGRTPEGVECHILTLPMTFTLGMERILAMVVEPEAEPEVVQPIPATSALMPPQVASGNPASYTIDQESSGYNRSSYTIDTDAQTRQFILRWPVIFKEAANLDKSVYFTHYLDWMGKVREIAMQPIADAFAMQMATGQWGMVTNSSKVQILGEPRMSDTIEVRYWVQRAPRQPESTMDLHFDWRRIDREGRMERVALGEMRTSWVALVGHGQVKAKELPDYFQNFIDARTPPDAENFRPEPLPERLKDLEQGALLYRRPEGPLRGPFLARRVFQTCLQDSNLVGNIYFANYYVWQARLVDHYVQPILPQIYRALGAMGELRCIHTRVEHLVDAMPFEDIEVVMSLEALHEHGVTFGFDYFRVQPDGTKQKLAFGEQECLWFTKQAGESVSSALPIALKDNLQQQI